MYVTKNLRKLDIFFIKKCISFFSLGKAIFLSLSKNDLLLKFSLFFSSSKHSLSLLLSVTQNPSFGRSTYY